MLYCETKSTDVLNKKRDSGDMINPDDQIYTKTFSNGSHKSEKDYYTVVLSFSERFGIQGIKIFKDSGDSPELAYKALLRQVAFEMTARNHIPM